MTGLPERLLMALAAILMGWGVLVTISVPAWPIVALVCLSQP
jgi:hypothetical protein